MIQGTWKPTGTFSLTAGVTMTSTATNSTTTMASKQETVLRQHGLAAQLKPQTAWAIGIETWPVKYSTTFHATVTVDGDVSPNDRGITQLSQIFSAAQRTFAVTGTIGFTDAADGQGFDWDVPFDASKCPSAASGTVTYPISIPAHAEAVRMTNSKILRTSKPNLSQ
jgi:hypothetical protein